MIGSRAFRALMRRNLIYRKRNLVGSALEFLLPVIFLAILVGIKKALEGNENFSPQEIPADIRVDNSDVFMPLSFTDYVTAIQADRICVPSKSDPSEFRITGMDENNFNWMVPFVKCDSRACKETNESARDLYCEYQVLGLAPKTAEDSVGKARAASFRDYVYATYPALNNATKMPFDYPFIKEFASDGAIETYVTSKDYGTTGNPRLALAVVFSEGSSIKDYAYTIRVNSTNYNSPEEEARPVSRTTPDTAREFDSFGKDDDTCTPLGGTPFQGYYDYSCTGQYMYNGALTTQRLIGDWIFTNTSAAASGYFVSEHGVQFLPFPALAYTEDGFYAAIAAFVPLLILLGLMYPVAAIIRAITLEKELRQKELMKMMSVTESDIGWSWFLSFFIFHLVTAVTLAGTSSVLYANSDFFYLFIFWLFTLMVTVVFGFLTASFITKSTRAVLIGLLLWFVGYFLTFVADLESGNSTIVSVLSLFPVTAFSYGLQEIGRLEDAGQGVTTQTFNTTDSPSGYTFATCIYMLIIDSILWSVVAWYFNRVIPTEYGTPLKFYFPFTVSYWCPGTARAPPLTGEETQRADEGAMLIEPVSNALKQQADEGRSIEIHGLSKVFGDKQAVDGLSLSMYSGQVTALLGHNGAGKTTTINMLTGMVKPTKGYAVIAGKDIRTQMNQIRQDVGICLQHDCLFPMLTVKEHIEFFARVKGMYAKMSKSDAEGKVMTSIEDVALLEKRNTLSKNLSGGMKRKLSVAIAFCGDSSTVLLDEPTSGMDPFSRRFTWNVIRQYRENRCIILTTHFMDEADILGDRIAIMFGGQLRCLGSSLYLKKAYGVGYQLTIAKTSTSIAHSNARVSNAEGSDFSGDNLLEEGVEEVVEIGVPVTVDDDLEDLVMSCIGNARLLSNVGTEMSFHLPMDESSSFNRMTDKLDKEVDDGRISTYGVSITPPDVQKAYGAGYQLTIAKASTSIAHSNARVANAEGNGDNLLEEGVEKPVTVDDDLEDLVMSCVENARLLSNVGTEMSFQLPMGASSSFNRMFGKLDKEVDEGRISTYGVSITTLDEVFLMVARGETGEKTHLLSSSRNVVAATKPVEDKSVRSQMDLEKEGLFFRHVRALFLKRAVNFKRDRKAWGCSVLLPSVFVLIGFVIFKFVSPDRNLDSLTINLDSYNPGIQTRPRNPIPFNEPGNFSCQPGVCSFRPLAIDIPIPETGEVYTFCGAPFFGSGESDLFGPSCSIAESAALVSRITEAGTVGIGGDMQNSKNASESVFETSSSFQASQYGALYFTHDGQSTYDNGTSYADSVVANCLAADRDYVDESTCERYRGYGYIVSYNFTALHASLLYQTLGDQSLLREALNDDEYTISPVVHPLPITASEETLGKAEDSFLAWFLLVLSFPFIAGSFATFIVMERQSKAKHLQTVAGVKPAAYWLSSYLWDIMNYQFPCWITVILMFAFNVETFTTTEGGVLGGVIVLLVLYGPATAGFTYCVSFMFSSPSMCNLFVIVFNFVIGMAAPLVTFILRLIGEDPVNKNESLITAANIVDWILRIVPSYCLGRGLFSAINLTTYQFLAEEPIDVWDPSVILYDVIFLGVECFVYLLLAIQIDKWSTNPRAVNIWRKFVRFITCRCGGATPGGPVEAPSFDDVDVIAEQDRILAGEANNDLIVMNQLTKVFPPHKVAVNHLSLGIPPGQCFGLLGINGAGKTTTMGMLTAEFPPSAGDATLAGYSVTNEPEQTRRRIGYCPQFDAHFENMTGREHVELYASIKGVPREFVKEAASRKLDELGLDEKDRDRLSSGYSGGMKRKLSVACATIGQPQVVFLDEPSTGMDPVARRDLWKVISDMVTGGNVPDEERTSVILTTHSMEECEALCPRLGIMAGGMLRCLGSAQHLKTRFGQGFQVEMKLKAVDTGDEDYITNLVTLQEGTPAVDEEGGVPSEEVFFDLQQTHEAFRSLSGDDYLSDMVNLKNPTGYIVFKQALSPVGVSLDVLALFATEELRMRNLHQYFESTYASPVLRERQETKARYEVGSEGTRISDIFSSIEENKENLMLSDYGVSQTSLEQVFNMFAAEAEELKHGTVDN